jgi:hypothetical protein
MTVHRINMYPISASGLNIRDFLTQAGEIGGQNGWCDV